MRLTLAALVALAMPHCHSHSLKMSNPIMGLYISYIDMYLCEYIYMYIYINNMYTHGYANYYIHQYHRIIANDTWHAIHLTRLGVNAGIIYTHARFYDSTY